MSSQKCYILSPNVFFHSTRIDTFQQMNSAGRLPMQILPELLKRFGIFVSIQELTKAAQELQYNCKIIFQTSRQLH